MTIPVIAIDGAAGSGKGTLSTLLAKKLGFNYLDSGKIYRLVAREMLTQQKDMGDETAALAIACELKNNPNILNMLTEPSLSRPEVGEGASQLAVYDQLRQELLLVQQNAKKTPGLVADGRDMQTTVFPDAALKVFLHCDVKIRARRRFLQDQAKGIYRPMPTIIAELKERDYRDTNRASSPLRMAEDAIAVDTADRSPEILAEFLKREYRTRQRSLVQENSR